jgi:hypothetical protein
MRPAPFSIIFASSLGIPIIKTPISENHANAISFYHSPMKKKGALPAGIPRASGERNSPTGNGASSHNQVRPSALFIVLLFLSISAASIALPGQFF